MITQIDLRHFKCFALLKLPLRSLTLLSGANATGKSSVLQALVLLHQTMREHEWSKRLMLNGTAVRLGTTADVIDQVHGRHDFEIALLDGERAYRWEFEGDRDELSMPVSHVSVDGIKQDNPQVLHHLLPPSNLLPNVTLVPANLLPTQKNYYSLTYRLLELTYLTAERLGPREYYMLDDPQLTPVVGPRGEYAISVLHSGRDTRVLDSLVAQDIPSTRFRQVEARMGRFFPGFRLAIEKVPHANAVTLRLRTSRDTDFHRPIHTGFGLTQVLPIVVAALSANRDGLLLIENPEVHLHPAGQAAMGEFLAEVAAAGVQVIIETHSDHVLNGIRRAVKNRTLPKDDVALHFFRARREDKQDSVPQVESPSLDAAGNIDTWPDGFFDQFDKDMNDFAGWI